MNFRKTLKPSWRGLQASCIQDAYGHGAGRSDRREFVDRRDAVRRGMKRGGAEG